MPQRRERPSGKRTLLVTLVLVVGCSQSSPRGAAAHPTSVAPTPEQTAGRNALTGLGSQYQGTPGDEHFPYPKLGSYNVIADLGGLVSGMDREYSPGVPEAAALASVRRELLPEDAKVLAQSSLPDCKIVIFTSDLLAASARYADGSGGFVGASVELLTGGNDSNAPYDPSSVGYLTILGVGPESLSANDHC